jgi:hypothetical protein
MCINISLVRVEILFKGSSHLISMYIKCTNDERYVHMFGSSYNGTDGINIQLEKNLFNSGKYNENVRRLFQVKLESISYVPALLDLAQQKKVHK